MMSLMNLFITLVAELLPRTEVWGGTETLGGDLICKLRPNSAGNRHLNSPACKLMLLVQHSIRCNGIILFGEPGTAADGCGTLLSESGLLKIFVRSFPFPFSVGTWGKKVRPHKVRSLAVRSTVQKAGYRSETNVRTVAGGHMS